MGYDVGVYNSYRHCTISCSDFLLCSESEPYEDRREIVGSPYTLSTNRADPVRCP